MPRNTRRARGAEPSRTNDAETAPAHCDAIDAMFVCVVADDILGTPVLDDDLDVDVVGNAREEPLDLRLDALAMFVVVIVTRCVENLGIDLGDTGHASGDLEGRDRRSSWGAATLSTVITTGTLELDISSAALSARCERSEPSKGTSMFLYMTTSHSWC